MLRTIVGVLLILASIVAAVYVGIFVMLVGGIVQIVDGAQAEPASAGEIAWGVVRVIFAGSAASLTAILGITAGIAMLDD